VRRAAEASVSGCGVIGSNRNESTGILPRQRADGAVVSQFENRMGANSGIHECFPGTAGYWSVLMQRYNWQRPHQFNGGLAPAVVEEKLNAVSGIS